VTKTSTAVRSISSAGAISVRFRLSRRILTIVTPSEARAAAVILRGRAVAWARSYGCNGAAEDIAHDALELLLRRAPDVQVDRAEAWLRAVVLTKARESQRPSREVLAEASPVSEAPDPEDTLASAQVAREVTEAMDRLARSRRDILRGVVAEGRPLVEVAAAEGVPESTARVRARDGAADLRGLLKRSREKEKRRTGGFSSWAAMLALLDLRAWARRSLAAFGAATMGGALYTLTVPVEPRLPEAVVIAPVVLAEDAPLPDTREPREAPASPVVVVRERARHDAGRRFRAERFGAE